MRSDIAAGLKKFVLTARLLNGKKFQKILIGITKCRHLAKLSAPTAKLRYKIQAICAHDLQNLLRKKINKTNPRLTLGFVLFLFGAGGGGLNLDKLTLVRRIARRHAPPFSLRENPQYYLPHFSCFWSLFLRQGGFLPSPPPKKTTRKSGLLFWCRWRGSNPHGIATTGF